MAGVAACLAAGWAFLVGGVFDLAGADPPDTGIAFLDELDDDTRADWGQRQVGLLKIFVLAPLALAVLALLTRALVGVGRRIRPEKRSEPTVVPTRAEPSLRPTPPPAPAVVATRAEPSALPAQTAPTAAAASPPQSPAEPTPWRTTAPPTRAAPTHLRLGETVTLRGIDRERTLVDATVLDVVDPITEEGAPGAQRPDRLVGIRIQLRNRGEIPYDDIPSGGSRVVADHGHAYAPSPAAQTSAFREIRLAPGESAEGMLAFRLPLEARPLTFRFTPNLGVAPDSGEWSLAPLAPPEEGG